MMTRQGFGHGQINTRRLAIAALLACIVVPLAFITVVNSNSHQLAILSLQLSVKTYGPLSTVEEEHNDGRQIAAANLTGVAIQVRIVQENSSVDTRNDNMKIKPPLPSYGDQNPNVNITSADIDLNQKKDEHESIVMTAQPPDFEEEEERGGEHKTSIVDLEKEEVSQVRNEHKTDSLNKTDDPGPLVPELSEKQAENNAGNSKGEESKLQCDFSEPRSDTCSMSGDIRVLAKSSTIILASPPRSLPANSMVRVRPYARKWETPVMQRIKEILIAPSSDPEHTPSCTVQQAVPAVVFSAGGFAGNFFHDFTDILVPLFATSRQFEGEVQFIVTDFNSDWISKYQPILRQLSRYNVVNLDTTSDVHCYPEVHVGLLSHRVFGMDPSKTPKGYSMPDFKQLLRSSFKLKRPSTRVIPSMSKKKPRLLLILRKGSRSITNAKEVVAAARATGFRVLTARPEDTRDLARFARVVNSADVLVGVHGAGLANMVFLPANASLVQIVPWGGLQWACRHDYGEPAADMGVRYVQYEIREEESSLIDLYPRNHAVFTDPASIHRQGWDQLWSVFLDKQRVKLDVDRFRAVLLEIYQSLKN